MKISSMLEPWAQTVGVTFYPLLVCVVLLLALASRLILFSLALYDTQRESSMGRIGILGAVWMRTRNGLFSAQSVADRLESSLPVFDLRILDWISGTGPALGLLGTLLGIASTFSVLRAGDLSVLPTLTRNLGQAMTSTIFGVSLAILSSLAELLAQRAMASAQKLITTLRGEDRYEKCAPVSERFDVTPAGDVHCQFCSVGGEDQAHPNPASGNHSGGIPKPLGSPEDGDRNRNQ